VNYPDPYVQPLILRALQRLPCEIISSITQLKVSSSPLVQITAYEEINFDHVLDHPQTSLACAYVIRKALIRKHYLSNTISTWLVKHPESVLRQHFKPCVHFELDYAEFLDEALIDAWDLNESMARNDQMGDSGSREWWILKPGMSDGGNGIRLFSSINELREIFEEWEVDENDDEEELEREDVKDTSDARSNGELVTMNTARSDESGPGTMASQLRHFIAQPYIDPPLLLKLAGNRNHKFHIRAYVLAVGALKVYVYREMLALFAAKPYHSPSDAANPAHLDLAHHLTNTCFQDESTRDASVYRFWGLDEDSFPINWRDKVFSQICDISGEVFEAAAREQVVHFQTMPNTFELLGVDFLVDANLKVWVLELNAYPDFKQTGQELQEVVVGGLFEDVIEVAVGPFFDPHCDRGGTERMVLVRDIDLGRR
jgi:tubulin---tyrosine ligase